MHVCECIHIINIGLYIFSIYLYLSIYLSIYIYMHVYILTCICVYMNMYIKSLLFVQRDNDTYCKMNWCTNVFDFGI